MQSDTATLERDDLTIAEMSHVCGVSPRTLRFYEQIELLNPRRVGSQRIYSVKDKVRLEMILTGKRLGFSLRDISDMLRSHWLQNKSESAGLVDTLDLETVQQQIVALERQKADIDSALAELKTTLSKNPQAQGGST